MSFVFQKINGDKLTHYTIFGERHSGTKLTEKIIHYNTSLIHNHQYGWKHGFGFNDPEFLLNNNHTLFLCLVRNPYDWLLSFFKQPYHVPKHNTRNIQTFLSKEWYSVYDPVFLETEIFQDRNFLTLDRYKNIFELRKYKVYYLRQVLTQLCSNILIIQYEQLTQRPEEILSSIIELLKLDHPKEYNIMVRPKKIYPCDESILNMIDTNIDWTFEHTIGYKEGRYQYE
jgi:hypothetical protein